MGSAIHQYAMRYVFDLPYFFIDYVPLIGLAVFAGLYVAGSELLAYFGFTALLAAGMADLWLRFGKNPS